MNSYLTGFKNRQDTQPLRFYTVTVPQTKHEHTCHWEESSAHSIIKTHKEENGAPSNKNRTGHKVAPPNHIVNSNSAIYVDVLYIKHLKFHVARGQKFVFNIVPATRCPQAQY